MSDETIVAVYDTQAHAEAAAADLRSANIPDSAISMHAKESVGNAVSTSYSAEARPTGFWSNLFGGEPEHDTAVYDRSLEGGSTVLTVKAPAQHVTAVADILERHHPVDMDERASGYGLATTQTTPASTPLAGKMPTATTAATGEESIQLAEEQLVVGKRALNRGTTRVRRFVVETPVEQQVSLHDEVVTIERHPVTDVRPVTDADFSEKTIEMTETSEEAVVGKTAHVYEQVNLSKKAVDHVETVKDTVRREEIEVEKVPAAAATTTATSPLKPVSPKI